MPRRKLSLALLIPTFALLGACGGGSSPAGSGRAETGDAGPNQPPVAVAHAAATVQEGAVVALDGSASSDSHAGALSYAWTQTAGVAVALSGAQAATATFTAPQVTGDQTMLAFELAVTDRSGAVGRDHVSLAVQPRTFALSGTIRADPAIAADGDVNDWHAPQIANDDRDSAQSVPNPIILGGYVSVPGAGAPGPLQSPGDPSDFYRVTLRAGQSVSMLVADPQTGDPDLYLWDAATASVVDASLGTGALESLTIVSSGEYLVEVAAYDGASNYTLVVGEAAFPGLDSGMELGADFVPGEIVLERRPADRATAQSLDTTLAGLGVRRAAGRPGRPELVRVDQGVQGARAAAQPVTVSGIDRAGTIVDPDARRRYQTLLAIKALRRQPSIVSAQPNFRVRAQTLSADPLYPLQWHYPLIDLPAAWALTTGDPAVTVAVLDTGVLGNHPDLTGRLTPGYDFVSSLSSSGDGDGLDADPTDPGDGDTAAPSAFHGTHVIGTVAADRGNGIGGSGVAPGVKVMPVRVLGTRGGSSYDIIQGLRYAAGLDNDSGTLGKPVDVINLSLGRLGACWPTEQAAFDAAWDAGIVVVAAAGNDAVDAAGAFPADCGNVIAVGAVDAQGEAAAYSNFGTTVDVLAPGGRSADIDGDGHPDGVLSLSADDTVSPPRYGYGYKSGTSMASPHVAAVVALMKSVNPSLTPADVDRLLAAGEITNASGIIDAYRAVSVALNVDAAPPPADARLTASPAALNFPSAYNYAEIDLHATGAGILQADAPVVSEPWLHVAALAVDRRNLGRYRVTVDRSGLTSGSYTATIDVGSEWGGIEIPVTMQVSNGAAPSDAGHLYVLLVDATSNEVVRQMETDAVGGIYSYRFDAVDDGSYRLIAGTDSDNDLLVCDAGESCGGYPDIASAGVTVNRDNGGVDFSVGHLLSIAAGSPGTGRQTARESSARVVDDKLVNVVRQNAGTAVIRSVVAPETDVR